MAGLDAPFHPDPPRRKRRGGNLLLFLALAYAGIRLYGGAFRAAGPLHPYSKTSPPPILAAPDSTDDSAAAFHFSGRWLRGTGSALDLGDRHVALPASLLARFFPATLIAPSCLTLPRPADPPAARILPVRDDWPGFYGAPWVARSGGNLFALLRVTAARRTGLAVPAPGFEIYANYDGSRTSPDFATTGAASFTRGSRAVLYRVFMNGPVRCLDLVVENGQNRGNAHLYYRKYRHYYEMDAIFRIAP